MLNFKIHSMMSDGEVTTSIDGKSHAFRIDAAHLPRLRKLYGRSPGYALNFLKEHNTMKPNKMCPVCRGWGIIVDKQHQKLPLPDVAVRPFIKQCAICNGTGNI